MPEGSGAPSALGALALLVLTATLLILFALAGSSAGQ